MKTQKQVEKNTQQRVTVARDEYIQLLSNKNDLVHFSTKNTKTGACVINLSLPICCCRPDAPCRLSGKCYCMKGHQDMARALACYYRNLRLYNSDKKDFWQQVESYIKHNPLPLFRFFDAGDFPSTEFVVESIELAKKFPNIQFLAFTKQYEMVNEALKKCKLPKNYTIRFSMWDKDWQVDNPNNLPVAYVDFNDSELTPEMPEKTAKCPTATNKSITCSMCRICWNKKVQSVVFKQH